MVKVGYRVGLIHALKVCDKIIKERLQSYDNNSNKDVWSQTLGMQTIKDEIQKELEKCQK